MTCWRSGRGLELYSVIEIWFDVTVDSHWQTLRDWYNLLKQYWTSCVQHIAGGTFKSTYQNARSIAPKAFQVGDFYYRSLVEVLREKLANYENTQHFHHQPYEFWWQPDSANVDATSKRVYSKLYTSTAFLEAHNRRAAGCPSRARVHTWAGCCWNDALNGGNTADYIWYCEAAVAMLSVLWQQAKVPVMQADMQAL